MREASEEVWEDAEVVCSERIDVRYAMQELRDYISILMVQGRQIW